ncbi:sulfurtransferase [Urechidicola vernalis]|uniref:Sulfurtransferase n=1 Tax=Urechidicola vernalis TaxID=3075600 RepID=A0ABU2Y0N5_9FLAO|nr:sulfurtransferase [Urechidicola sp. P050]MDT0551734.1 sulfurtransferase [Urechidicola sp. P050]
MLKVSSPIVSVEWLSKNLNQPNLIVFDATIQKVTDKSSTNGDLSYIKNALFFDIKKEFSVQGVAFPNTMLTAKEFQEKSRSYGVNNDSCIVVYDRYGYYSCARVWWMFKSMGFENIAVLDGGLPAWNEAKLPIQSKANTAIKKGDFIAKYKPGMIHDHVPVLKAIDDFGIGIIDARGSSRFNALVEEPRPGLRSGHIPNSKNLPYTDLLDGVKMKSENELKTLFGMVKNKQIIFSCGSGITACVLALGAEIAGIENKSVYDGSWTEWGSLTELPIEK